LRESGQISLSSDDTTVDTALSESNSEETVLTPIWAPRVSNNPVVGTIFITPTNNFNSVTTEDGSTLVSVDTTSVGHEVGVDGEASFDGSVLEDVSLDRSRVRELNDGSLGSVIIFNGSTISALSEIFALNGLSTIVRSIWEAAVSDETIADEEPPENKGVPPLHP